MRSTEASRGKERLARAIHDSSKRARGRFVTVNCAAMPVGLIEAELMGHERGAFTGAANHRIGRFELAHDGTLFLDELGELPIALRPKLLRMLQEREFERLGSSRTQHSNVRIGTRPLAPSLEDDSVPTHGLTADQGLTG